MYRWVVRRNAIPLETEPKRRGRIKSMWNGRSVFMFIAFGTNNHNKFNILIL